jgi:hypothetical protein
VVLLLHLRKLFLERMRFISDISDDWSILSE